ncbi:MAG: hypothetical protein JW807_01200 [Spirochaetes bacterium]|nr:hypothetical protein [Spirochaetota bacterium]
MKEVDRINRIIESIASDRKNLTGELYLNAIQNEFITIRKNLHIPRIEAKCLDYSRAAGIVADIADVMPEFLRGHRLLEYRKPAAEQHSLHFLMKIPGRVLDFIHILRIDLMFGGDSSNVVERGDTNFYPSFRTNRLYYKSRTVPVREASENDFEPLRLQEDERVESDNYFHTYALFDEFESREASKDLCAKFDADIFNISLDLYQFISYDYFTACMNVLYPVRTELASAVELFECMFIFLFSQYRNIEEIVPLEKIRGAFAAEINCGAERITLTKEYIERLKNYFSRFSMYRDEEMLLKGWRRIDIRGI